MHISMIRSAIYLFSISTLLSPITVLAIPASAVSGQNKLPLPTISADMAAKLKTKHGFNKAAASLLKGLVGVTSSDCAGNGPNAMCVLAQGMGVLKVSTDAGNTWTEKSVSGLSGEARFMATSCTGEGSNAVCAVVGFSKEDGPLLVVSANGGKTWETKPVQGLPEEYKGQTLLSTVSCTGSGSTAMCAAGGWFGVFAATTDAGKNWTLKTMPDGGVPRDMGEVMFSSVSCTGNGGSARCAAVGGLMTAMGYFPTPVYVSADNGNTWETKTSFGFPNDLGGAYLSISCTGSGSDDVCAAVGVDINRGGNISGLFLTTSANGGNDWVKKSVPGLDSNGPISSVSCTGSGPTAVCVASGWHAYNAEGPLAVSVDGGATWAVKSEAGVPDSKYSQFHSVSCNGSGPTAHCVAAGEGKNSSLLVSEDGGSTWSGKTMSGLPESGRFAFYSVKCNHSLPGVCVALGEAHSKLLLAVSADGGNTWALKSSENK